MKLHSHYFMSIHLDWYKCISKYIICNRILCTRTGHQTIVYSLMHTLYMAMQDYACRYGGGHRMLVRTEVGCEEGSEEKDCF